MALTNSVAQILQGFGIAGLANSSATSTTITSNAVTITLTLPSTALGNLGYVRCKVSNVDGSHAISSVVMTATDSTTTIYIPEPVAISSGTNGQGLEFTKAFMTDLNLRTFVAVITGASGVTTMTCDYEVWAQEAAGGP